MVENIERIGSFTSSEIHKLMTSGRGENGFGAPGITYIKEKQIERRMGRSLDVDISTKVLSWGKFLEMRVFSLLGIEYDIQSKSTDKHPTIEGWAGSKDLLRDNCISDIKCFQPKNFALFTDMILAKNVEQFKADFPKEYWQLVSNAIINDVKNAEALSYMPFKAELDEIRAMAADPQFDDDGQYNWIQYASDAQLAYLPDGGYYHNLNRFEFEVPEQDKSLLTVRVGIALAMLEKK